MARRKEHSHDEIRQMAIAEVQEALARGEGDQLSLRRVATQIGYAPSTLINIFGSYNYLLLAVSEACLQQLLGNLVCDSPSSPLTALEQMARRYAEFALAAPDRFRLLFELQLSATEPLPEHHSALIEQLLSLPLPLLALQLRRDADTLVTEARLLWGAIHGLVSLALTDKLFGGEHTLGSLVCQQVRTLIAGFESGRNT
ncbi:TetR/AcrR family transcriptional regulator [Shewanella cyperi]|uniref:TetR/AcrR family transcriptional regulator n=1 Tax=Shewanella cyperi TaxID=2814292 RepID=UPI001A94A689|nr:TetR-like C-terminal domain-containing protein [Shewanella cyperi]QSX41029.1 TetR/AcrR family transcriptional regulator [Shewanella cyperi]